MCGIVGYVGHREATPILLQGLKRLEYRGYDSAGVATLAGSHLSLRKRAGRLAALTELLSAIETVVDGDTFLSPSLAPLVVEHYVRMAKGKPVANALEALSGREREVLQLLAEGNSSAEIAHRLHISARTVDTHRHNLMEKLDIHSIAGLTKFAIRNGLCDL